MTKKRSFNGFMYFADARRAVYEAENRGIHLTAKKLVERATRDWKVMSEEERQKWRSESRRRRDETEVLAKRRFGMLTVRPYCIFESNGSGDELICPPAEICTYVMSLNEGIIDNKRILIRHDYPTNHQFCQFSRISENSFSELSQPPNHINIHHACLRIANEMRGCWANLILVPASQYQHLAASLVWIKQKRDTALKRDTVSIRAERLICMEDMIAVIGRLVETDVDDSSRWEQNISSNLSYACDLHAAAPSKCPMVIGKSACQHFLDILRNLVNCNYRAREECIFEIDNAKRYKNSIARPVCHNRINPFQITSRRDPKDNHITNDEPFSLIRLRTPEKMQYVTKWLNSLDLSAQMLESDNTEEDDFQTNYLAFTGNFQKELLNLDGPSRQC